MQKNNIDNPTVKNDVKNLLTSINMFGEDGAFGNMRFDFLEMCFTEFIGSKRFTELDSNRRKDLFNQYQLLICTMETLDSFTSKFTNGIEFAPFTFTVNPANVLQPLPRVPKPVRKIIKNLVKPVKKKRRA